MKLLNEKYSLYNFDQNFDGVKVRIGVYINNRINYLHYDDDSTSYITISEKYNNVIDDEINVFEIKWETAKLFGRDVISYITIKSKSSKMFLEGDSDISDEYVKNYTGPNSEKIHTIEPVFSNTLSRFMMIKNAYSPHGTQNGIPAHVRFIRDKKEGVLDVYSYTYEEKNYKSVRWVSFEQGKVQDPTVFYFDIVSINEDLLPRYCKGQESMNRYCDKLCDKQTIEGRRCALERDNYCSNGDASITLACIDNFNKEGKENTANDEKEKACNKKFSRSNEDPITFARKNKECACYMNRIYGGKFLKRLRDDMMYSFYNLKDTLPENSCIFPPCIEVSGTKFFRKGLKCTDYTLCLSDIRFDNYGKLSKVSLKNSKECKSIRNKKVNNKTRGGLEERTIRNENDNNIIKKNEIDTNNDGDKDKDDEESNSYWIFIVVGIIVIFVLFFLFS